MKLEQFAMERMQSTWENLVDFNLSESGVHPLTPRELLAHADLDVVLDQPLVYTQSNGTHALRSLIAQHYPGATADQSRSPTAGPRPTTSSSWRLIEPGDEVAMLVPNYMQTWGLVRAFGGHGPRVAADRGPRGRPLAARSRRARARRVGPHAAHHHLHAEQSDRRTADRRRARRDCGASRTGTAPGCFQTRSIAAPSSTARRRRRCGDAATASSSPAACRRRTACPGCASAGLSAPPSFVASTWSYHDYTTIAPGALSDRLARVALDPARRPALLERTRAHPAREPAAHRAWLRDHAPAFSWTRPRGGRDRLRPLQLPINSTELVTRLRDEKSVLIVPGDHFGMDGYLRLGFGERPDYLNRVSSGCTRCSRRYRRSAAGAH